MNQKLLPSKLFLLAFILLSIATASTFAQTKKISMQGFLKDANGKAVSDGDQSLTFKIYTVASGGTAIWTEDQTLKVFGGVYSAQLGSTSNISALAWDVPYFVGVTVQGTELTPRTELTYAPYSFGTNKAQEVVCSGAVGDVKYSILNPTQFAAVNGACWIPMDGRTITGSKLATILGVSSVANAGGLFLRGQEFSNSFNHDPERDSNSPIATMQEQSFLSHNHSGSTDSRGGEYLGTFLINSFIVYAGGLEEGKGNPDYSYNTGNVYAPTHSHNLNINNTGGNETRPKNLNLWTYIRIN